MTLKCNYAEMDQAEQKREGVDLKKKKAGWVWGGRKGRKETFTVTQMEKF